MAKRIGVFVDYQNVYKGARKCFFPDGTNSHLDGQVNPLKLGKTLAGNDRTLVAVRVYRGLPSSRDDPKGYGASNRQLELWKKLGCVETITRPLNYGDPAHPKEKGIDVKLAIDFVTSMIAGDFDVGILFSADTDLLPALEAVIEAKGEAACEVAAWVPKGGGYPSVLRVPSKNLHTHPLYESTYLAIHDDTDYTQRRRRR